MVDQTVQPKTTGASSSESLKGFSEQAVSAGRVIHTHPIKTIGEIQAALSFGCRTFVYDNPDELEKFKPYRDRVELLLRIAFRNTDAAVDLSKKFGAPPADAITLLKRACDLGLRTVGFSFHVGSQCANSRAHVSAIEACRGLMAAADQARLPAMNVLDIGGGFPASYSEEVPAIHRFCAPIRDALKQLPSHIQVVSEPGRYLVASAGHSASSVVGKANRDGAPWYYLDDGIYGSFGAQVFDGIRYPLSVLTANRGPARPSHLAGPTCDSGDMIAEGIPLPGLDIGDVVVAHMMGAYTSVTANDFNSVKRAKILALNGPQSCEESGTMKRVIAE